MFRYGIGAKIVIRNVCIFGLLLVTMETAITGQSRDKPPKSERGIREGVLVREVREVKRQYDVATSNSDGSWFQRVFAEDYVWIGPRGEVVTKAEYIRDLDSRDLTWESVAVKDMQVRVYGDTAIATGRFFGKGHYRGSPLDERQRFTTVLIKRNGGWQIVAEHCSSIAAIGQ